MEDRWRRKPIGEIMRADTRTIRNVATMFNLSENYGEMLVRQHEEVFEQLSKATSIGRILQEMLLERMTRDELSRELKRRMIMVEARDNETEKT